MHVALVVYEGGAETLLHKHKAEEVLRGGGLREGDAGGKAGVVERRGLCFLKGFGAGLCAPDVLHPPNVRGVEKKALRLPSGPLGFPPLHRLAVKPVPLWIRVDLPSAEAVELAYLLHHPFLLRVAHPHSVGADGEAKPRLRDDAAHVEELGMFRRFPSADYEKVVPAGLCEVNRLAAGVLRHKRGIGVGIVYAVRTGHSASVCYLEKHSIVPCSDRLSGGVPSIPRSLHRPKGPLRYRCIRCSREREAPGCPWKAWGRLWRRV